MPEAIVAIVARLLLAPCRRTKETVSVVPVDGAQVMLKGVPAVMEDKELKVKAFCAAAREARAANKKEVEYCMVVDMCGEYGAEC